MTRTSPTWWWMSSIRTTARRAPTWRCCCAVAAATIHSQPGKPLGKICPVATSATLGEGGDEARIREVAEQVFGTEFGEGSVITERRLPAEGFLGEIDYSLPLPAPQELAGLGHPRVDDQAMAEIAKLVTGQEITDRAELGRVLRTHILTHALMDVLERQAVHIRRGAGSAAPEGRL